VTLDDLQPGDEIPPASYVTDPQQMRLMAALLRDPNPIHFDVESVKVLGLGDRLVTQGPMTLSFLAETITSWAGLEALRSLNVRMLGNVFAGDTVVCTGTVADRDDERGLVTIEVQAAVDDVPVVAGTATIGRC
jgi:acyl dehydratase